MATNPMMQGQPANVPTPMMPGDDLVEDTGGYSIEIEVAADGSITVSAETDTQEETEGGQPDTSGAPEKDDGGTPVGSIDEALALAKKIFQNGGKMQSRDSAMRADIASKVWPKPAMKPGMGMM